MFNENLIAIDGDYYCNDNIDVLFAFLFIVNRKNKEK